MIVRFGVLAMAVATMALGCKQQPPVEGAACKPSQRFDIVCASKEAALECRDGKWRAVPCLGPMGCVDLNSDPT